MRQVGSTQQAQMVLRPKGVRQMEHFLWVLWFMMRTSCAPHSQRALRRSMPGKVEGRLAGSGGMTGATSAPEECDGPKEIGEEVGTGPGSVCAGAEAVLVMRAILANNSTRLGPLPCRACMSLLRSNLESMTRREGSHMDG